MSFVHFDRVWLAYNEELEQAGHYAVEDISLEVERGEFIAIVGPSGCGKSTFMKLATGLKRPSKGTIHIGGQAVTGPLKITGMAFQAPSLLPWRTTVQNVTSTEVVTKDDARSLGLWSDSPAAENPPVNADDKVEIPAWRHAIINYPHPLLRRGLVVVDTPGLNAIGAEPELTLGLLPNAHAALFVLGADTGVTRSDLDIWTHHLGGQGLACFVVLNKVDTLADPLASEDERNATIERQCVDTASTLRIELEAVEAERQNARARIELAAAISAQRQALGLLPEQK